MSSRAIKRTLDWRFLVTLVVILMLAWFLYSEAEKRQEADALSIQERASLSQRLAEVEAARQTDAKRLLELGERPTPVENAPEAADGVVVIPGPQGDKGERGESCIEELGVIRCRGDEGKSGSDGTSGTPGANGVDGAQGPTGPAGPKGDPGTQGERGPAGADGRGIQSIACEGGQLVVTYTDGAFQPIAGSSCIAAPGNPGGTP